MEREFQFLKVGKVIKKQIMTKRTEKKTFSKRLGERISVQIPKPVGFASQTLNTVFQKAER